MLMYQVSGIESRAYADDIVCIWKSIDEARKTILIMKEWWTKNKMEINPAKSGILRILIWKSKWIGISNELMIPEIENYRYWGVTINQWLKLRDHKWILKNSEAELRKRIGILKPALLNTKSRLILYRTILKFKYWYAAAVLWIHTPCYATKLDSILYRLLKQFFHIKSNVKKALLFKVLNAENSTSLIHKTINKLGVYLKTLR